MYLQYELIIFEIIVAPTWLESKSKLNLAGLVGGDSDSSALTQESGDEARAAETPMERW